MSPARILVTGATGFLGSNLILSLLKLGHEVIVLKRKKSNLDRIYAQLDRVVLYDVEEVDLSAMFNAHGQVGAVIHAATCYGRAGEPTSVMAETNTIFPLRLMETAAMNNVDIFFNIDTILPANLNSYSLSKSQFLEWGKMFSSKKKIRFVNIKLEHIYGPGDSNSKFTTHTIKSCLENIPELSFTLGEQRRDFIYIDDVVDACLKILDHTNSSSLLFQEYEVGSGNVVTIRKFVELVKKITHSSTQFKFGAIPYRENEMMDCNINIDPLKFLGWKNNVDLASGIRSVIRDLSKEQEKLS